MSVYLGTEKISVYTGGIISKPEEEKTVTAGTSVIEVLPSSGKTMKKVTINPAPIPTELVLTPPTKTSYTAGEALDLTGIAVKAKFNNGTEQYVTSECTFNPANDTVLYEDTSEVVISWNYGDAITFTTTQAITVKPNTTIYGVEWDGTSTTTWTRTDAAELFTNPVPYVSGASSYGSPFDNCSPWKDMQIVNDVTAGKLVSIPKYYYKWTKTGSTMKLQIADGPVDGFHVSPAHADRGDGKGERDVVYVGRYHCNSSYKSVAGSTPLGNMTRATARTNIHNLGSTYWQYDFAMYWTICMLYLVEFADWNSQAKIGYGCSPSGSKWNVGYTDSMPYHTGTTASARTSYGGTQYRYIEGLWDNVFDWCDGIYFSGANVYCIKNPASFSDSSGGTLVGTRPTSGGWISAFNVPTANGFEYALYTSAISGSENTYITDYCGSGGVVLFVGGFYYQYQYYGLFSLGGDSSASSAYSYVGSRLQKLP